MGTLFDNEKDRVVLRDLPLVPRLVIAVFLIAVGIGYFSALVQLHFQQASAGQFMPGAGEVKDAYHGKEGMGQLERLIVADEGKPFTASGSMRAAFTSRSGGWARKIKELAAEKKLSKADAEKELRKQREYAINGLLAWIHGGATEDSYTKGHVLPDDFFKDYPKGDEPDSDFFEKNKDGKWTVKVTGVFDGFCTKCHAPGKGGAAGQIHLDSFQNVADYVPSASFPEGNGGMSLTKLAQSTHAHLLSFAMLYGLTGLCFAFTSYPFAVRALVAPLALIAQMIEISFWWLARIDPVFANGILVMGGLVALCLGTQIVLSLLNLFEKKGKVMLVLVALAFLCLAGAVYVQVIWPHMESQKMAVVK